MNPSHFEKMPTNRSSSPTVSNVVSVKIFHKGSGNPIANLEVDLIDLENWPDPESGDSTLIASLSVASVDIANLYKTCERAGSAVTNASGECSFDLTPKDFNLPRKTEQKPDLLLVVLAPEEPGFALDKRVLYFSRDVRFNAGSKEAYVIRLPTDLLEEKGIPYAIDRQDSPDNARSQVALYVNQRESERTFAGGVADYHATLAVQDIAARKAFRADFFKKIATDFSTVPVTGVLVGEGDPIGKKNMELIDEGIGKANTALGPSGRGVPVNLYLTPADKERLKPFFENATGDFVEIPESELADVLFRRNSSENPGTLLIHSDPIASFCATETTEEVCAKHHAGIPTGHGSGNGATPPPNGNSSTNGITNDDIPRFIAKLVENMPSPDRVLQPELSKRRPDAAAVEESVKAFSLPKGPAEGPARRDVDSLQIAFDHVWKQLFDEDIPNLAYTANTIAKSRFGVDAIASRGQNFGRSIIDTFFTVLPVDVPPVIAKLFDITKEEYNEMSAAIRQELLDTANAIIAAGTAGGTGNEDFTGAAGLTVQQLRRQQSLIEQGERLIDSVRHDNYYTLHRTLRDLHERLSGTYEFTVFAADKDFHSVKFGLLITHRLELAPIGYQAGDLVKTIPLAPGEERTYSVKVNRTEKRTLREAKKNNSSLVNEQSTTNRVEADILAKAQTKTNFGLNTEGDFDIGIFSGKATTTFGVEALSESAQTRKDVRDTLQKAVQALNEEISYDFTRDETLTTESSETGKIANTNQELSMTAMSFALEKLFRVSVLLYRVTPMVLVAQEVPSPNQITEAWVIAHDWILNRCLLDDSFRPTLHYLAKKSVGDDFSLRELRKNLRQQRNLVDTFRIEFSAASVEADNRYKALETAISTRIDEEHGERGDGLFSDIGQFFGGDGQDPEAAKARELAAKDAHHYALEKAEKAAAALRQEVNTLHMLTEKYNRTLQDRLDNETQVKRLLEHIRSNIFHYMKHIWMMEPDDQRILRLQKVQVPVLKAASRIYRVKVLPDDDIFAPFREPGTQKHKAFLHGTLEQRPDGSFETKSLAELVDLGQIKACFGNCLGFQMLEHNALTEFMAAPYIDATFGAMDPDELANVSLDTYAKYICCLHDRMSEDDFEAIKPKLKQWLAKLLSSPLRNGDEVVVPTGSLFMQSLVDQNPVLEDFKLRHRELDVYKVDMDVRKAGWRTCGSPRDY